MGYRLQISFDHIDKYLFVKDCVSLAKRYDKETFDELYKEKSIIRKYDAETNETLWLLDTKKALENGHELQVRDGTYYGLSKKFPGQIYVRYGPENKTQFRGYMAELEKFIADGGLKEDY